MSTSIQKQRTVKTVGIKNIQLDGYEDVYNMEVKGTHNFAVNGGLIVHNCMDALRYMIKTMKIVKKDISGREYKENEYVSLFERR